MKIFDSLNNGIQFSKRQLRFHQCLIIHFFTFSLSQLFIILFYLLLNISQFIYEISFLFIQHIFSDFFFDDQMQFSG